MKKRYYIAAVALLLAPLALWGVLLTPAGQGLLKGLCTTWLGAGLDAHVRIGRLDTDLFTRLEMRDVVIRERGRVTEAKFVEATFGVWRPLLNRPLLRELNVNRLRIETSADETDWETLADEASVAIVQPRFDRWIPESTAIRGMAICVGDTLASVEALRFIRRDTASPESGQSTFVLEADSIDLRHGNTQLAPVRIAATLAVTPHLIEVSEATVSGAGVALVGHGSYGDETWRADLRGTASLHELVSVVAADSLVRADVDLRGEFGSTGRDALGAWWGQLDLKAARPRVGHAVLDSVRLALSVADGNVRLDTLLIAAGDGRIAGRGRLAAGPSTIATMTAQLHQFDARWLAQMLTATPSVASGPLSGNLNVDVPLGAPEDWRIDADLTAPSGLRLARRDLGISHLSATREPDAVSGRLQSEIGTVVITGSIGADGRHDLTWRASDLDLARLEGKGMAGISGRATLSARSVGRLSRPVVQATGLLSGARLAGFGLGDLLLSSVIDSTTGFEASLEDEAGDVRISLAGGLADGRIDAGRLWISKQDISAAGWGGDLAADLAFSGTLLDPQLRGRAQVVDLTFEGQDLGGLAAEVELVNSRGECRVALLDSAVFLTGTIDLEGAMPFSAHGRVTGADLAPLLAIATKTELDYRGRLSGQLTVRGEGKHPGKTFIDLQLSELLVHSEQRELHLAAPARARFEGGTVNVEDLELRGDAGSIHLAGAMGSTKNLDLNLGVRQTALSFLAPFVSADLAGLTGTADADFTVVGTVAAPIVQGTISSTGVRYKSTDIGNVGAALTLADGTASLSDLVIELPQGKIRGAALVPVRRALAGDRTADERAEVWLRFEGARIDSVFEFAPGLVLGASGHVRANGRGLDLRRASATLEFEELFIRDEGFALANDGPVRVTLGDEALEAGSLRLRLASRDRPDETVSAIDVGGSIDRYGYATLTARFSAVDLAALGAAAGMALRLDGELDASAVVTGTLDSPRGEVHWSVTPMTLDTVPVSAFSGRGVYFDDILRLEELDLALPTGKIAGSATIDLGEWANRHSGLHRGLAARLRVEGLELSQIKPLVRELENLSGVVDAVIEVTDSAGYPQLTGSLAVTKGRVKLRDVSPLFAFEAGRLTVEAGRVSAHGFEGRAGQGDWSLTGGARLRGVRLDSFEVDLATTNLDVRGPQYSLNTTARLRCAGVPGNSTVSGQITVNRGRLTAPVSLRTLLRTPRRRGAGLPVVPPAGQTGLQVELQADRVRIRNDLLDATANASISVSGTTQRPVLDGQVRAEGGYFYYLDRRFTLDHGALLLTDARPDFDLVTALSTPHRLNPNIEMAASHEMKANNGNEYDVNLRLSGRLGSPEFELTSEPALSRVAILSLLSVGQTDVALLDAQGMIVDRAATLGAKYLLSATQSRFRRVLGLEELQLDPKISSPGRMASSKLTLTKQWGRKTRMTYSTPVGYAGRGRVRLDYEFADTLFLQTERDAEGESGLDLSWKLRFR